MGIGGSAGGLETFEDFFARMPSDSGMAFVVVQHLDPTHKGMLPELLQRYSSMPVVQIEDGMQVKPNSIYVIPPNKDLSILHGTLQLLEPASARGLRLPIDFFFKSLAQDQGDKAVAIIVSGMGTDGTLGLRSIKEKLGMVMVQDPESATFNGMPNSALSTGLEDYIAPASELPSKLLEYARHRQATLGGAPELAERALNSLQKIIVLLRARTQHDFSLYKKDTLNRRIKRRMDIHLIDNPEGYVRYLQENPHEVDLLFKEMLIGVTSFFRDAQAYEALKETISTKLREEAESLGTLRAWVVGCSTGEEAYSIAMILHEAIDGMEQKSIVDLQIFATDIDKEAIEIARHGVYPSNIAADVSPERLQRYFTKEENNYRVKKDIRDSMIFAPQNVIMDPPFTRMDLVSCRNLLIYFSPELQQKVLPLFHYSLKPKGVLFLGPSESVAGKKDLFTALDNKAKIFQRKETDLVHAEAVEFPIFHQPHKRANGVSPARERAGKDISMADIAQNFLMEGYTPPAVLVNDQGDILYINGRTGKYLEPSPGKANLNVYAMARTGLRNEIGIAARKALTQGTDVIVKGIKVGTNGGQQMINLTARPITNPRNKETLLMIVFQDVDMPKRVRRRKGDTSASGEQPAQIKQLEEELKTSREHLQDMVEQMQATSEELQSANEELQSSNEELQSTNEELTTSKEEMQSLNEELGTVNSELTVKVDLLSQVNNDMKNLLNSTQIATIFLDNDLKIKRFTSEATNIIKLIDSDVGRPVSDLVSNLEEVDIAGDAREVLDTLVFKQSQVQTSEGRWYSVRILPYRTLENVIDGVVLTFIDITDVKSLESAGAERDFARSIVDTVREPLLILDGNLKVVFASQPFYRKFGVTETQTEGQFVYDLGNKQWDISTLRTLLEDILPSRTEMNDFLVEHTFPNIGHRKMLLNAREIRRTGQKPSFILLALEDVTEKEQHDA